MQITISDKVIAEAIGYMLDGNLYDNYDAALIKAAKVPKRAELLKTVMADKKFMASMERQMVKYISDADVLMDFAYDSDSTAVNKAVLDCDKAYDKFDEERAIKQEAEDLKRSIRVLEAAGFKVTKNG